MKICIACPLGGHLDEMLRLMDAFAGHDYFFVTYKSEVTQNIKDVYLINLPRETTLNLIVLAINITFKAITILRKEKPDIIVSAGGLLSVPFSYVGKFLGSNIVFIESAARITAPSRSGKIVYPIADVFFVQWEQLLKKYGKKARYEGSVF